MNVSDEDAPIPTSDAQPTANAKRKRRPAKRDGSLQLQFLTATDPSQFKDASAKRSVRSQAMRHYRNSSDAQKKGKEEPPHNIWAERKSFVYEHIKPVSAQEHEWEVSPDNYTSQALEMHHEDQQYLYPSTSAAWWGANQPNPEHDIDEVKESSSEYSAQSLFNKWRYNRTLPIRSTKVIRYEDSDSHENLQMRILVGGLAKSFNIGDGVDPFVVLPQFKNPELSSLFLLRKCMRAFASDSTLKKWLPAMLAHPHIILSSTVLTSTWLDMHAGCSGDSKRTAMVKGETIEMINIRLRSPILQLDDTTLIVILHLLAGEMWSCDEKTLRIHESGVARFVMQRGGMCQLVNNVVGEVAAACCYHCDIFCEKTPLPAFQDWKPPEFTPDKDSAIPESPLFCPSPDFATIINDTRCSRYTYELLCDMRDLTDLFVEHHAKLDAIYDIENEESARLSPLFIDYDIKINEIRERLASLPSAYTPGLSTSNDWVYEACRIAALIYTASIIMRVPFSVSADPSQNPILSDPRASASPHAGGRFTTRLNEALYEVLERTDTANVWNDMSGVLYWVCAVGATASRTPSTINMMQKPRFRNESYMVWVRRCLIMFSTRTMIVLVFQHPMPIIMAQRTMLRVQAIIHNGENRAPATSILR